MRIIAGTAKGRRLTGPKGGATRPMTDRVREALFSSLGPKVVGARVLDLYAGTGSLGLEALSRGSASATFVERDRAALSALETNIAAVGLGGDVLAGSVGDHLRRIGGPFDLVFVDPPYGLDTAGVDAVMAGLDGLLAAGAVVVVHRRRGQQGPAPPAGRPGARERRYGDSVLWFFDESG